ncbi:GAF domain-containing protein [Microbacterium sp. 179-I 3D2 NHS]|uniref:GAF domain-containing protein n=1 Tax=Microbacterium sp. 179-I 3D2 NHS TaxID=3235178 RepID=UPI0039A3D16A
MRSRDDTVPAAAAVERALSLGVCGMGGRLSRPPTSLTDALVAVDALFGESFARRLERFVAVAPGAFVWTRDADGLGWLGRLTGPWRYDAASDAVAADLVHVRPCDWLLTPIPPGELPRPVAESFARGGRNWQQIRAEGAAHDSAALWARHQGV